MLSTSLFSSNGTVYKQSAVFGQHWVLNQTALDEIGLPALTGSNAWTYFTRNLGIGGLVAHVVLFWGQEVKDAIRQAKDKSQPDVHFQVRPSSWIFYYKCSAYVLWIGHAEVQGGSLVVVPNLAVLVFPCRLRVPPGF